MYLQHGWLHLLWYGADHIKSEWHCLANNFNNNFLAMVIRVRTIYGYFVGF